MITEYIKLYKYPIIGAAAGILLTLILSGSLNNVGIGVVIKW